MSLLRFCAPKSRKTGIPPGTPVFCGLHGTAKITINVMDYRGDAFEELQDASVDAVLAYKDRPSTTWINVIGVHDVGIIERISTHFGIHPLVQEDIVNTSQRPKFEDYDDALYLVVHMFRLLPEGGDITREQVSLILVGNCVISFQEREGDVFDPIRERLRLAKGRIRKMAAGYLFYALLDAVVDHCFIVLDAVAERLGAAETEVMETPTPATLRQIHRLKTDLIGLHRSLWPLREAISSLERVESRHIHKSIRVFLRDVYDHIIQVIDTVETFRDLASGLFDIYLSSVSNRMNEVMKVLTVIATIFIPITFIAGVYGMNFEHMPELKWPWGYYGALALMAAVAGGLLAYFRRKEWL